MRNKNIFWNFPNSLEAEEADNPGKLQGNPEVPQNAVTEKE